MGRAEKIYDKTLTPEANKPKPRSTEEVRKALVEDAVLTIGQFARKIDKQRGLGRMANKRVKLSPR